MTKKSWDVTDDELRQIGRIIETLNESSFAYLQIEFDELNLPLSKGPSKAADSTAATVGATPARAFTR